MWTLNAANINFFYYKNFIFIQYVANFFVFFLFWKLYIFQNKNAGASWCFPSRHWCDSHSTFYIQLSNLPSRRRAALIVSWLCSANNSFRLCFLYHRLVSDSGFWFKGSLYSICSPEQRFPDSAIKTKVSFLALLLIMLLKAYVTWLYILFTVQFSHVGAYLIFNVLYSTLLHLPLSRRMLGSSPGPVRLWQC